MSKAKVSELLLEALNRCLPLTAEDDKGCDGCPYEKICAEDSVTIGDDKICITVGLPRNMVEDIRKYLQYRKEAAHGQD